MGKTLERCRWCGGQKFFGEPCQPCSLWLADRMKQPPASVLPQSRYFVPRGAIPDAALRELATMRPGEVFITDCVGSILTIELPDEHRSWDVVAGMVSEDV